MTETPDTPATQDEAGTFTTTGESPFLDVLTQVRGGAVVEALDDSLTELVKACRMTRKQGEITLKIKVTPSRRDDGSYDVRDTVKLSKPELETGATLFFGTPSGRLQREHVDQRELDLMPSVVRTGDQGGDGE